ncbi:MAG: CcmD family protein [Bacteroidetes bacterium]|nr:CcmD family protein [Bacteroidota bacterium]
MINILERNKFLLSLFFLLASNSLFAQGGVEMADKLRESGKIYVVVAVLLVIFIGIAVILFMLDRKINKIEKSLRQ